MPQREQQPPYRAWPWGLRVCPVIPLAMNPGTPAATHIRRHRQRSPAPAEPWRFKLITWFCCLDWCSGVLSFVCRLGVCARPAGIADARTLRSIAAHDCLPNVCSSTAAGWAACRQIVIRRGLVHTAGAGLFPAVELERDQHVCECTLACACFMSALAEPAPLRPLWQ
jgi:hypothetical protein